MLPAGTEILKERGRLAHSYKITSTSKLIDDARGEHTRLACSDGCHAGRSSSSESYKITSSGKLIDHARGDRSRECAPPKPEGTPQVASAARGNMVGLPWQLLTNTPVPACIWCLMGNKHIGSGRYGSNLELPLAA